MTHGMAIAGFPLQDKLGRVRFFEKTFVLADTSMEVALGMSFLTLSNADIWFAEKELVWRSSTTGICSRGIGQEGRNLVVLISGAEQSTRELPKHTDIYATRPAQQPRPRCLCLKSRSVASVVAIDPHSWTQHGLTLGTVSSGSGKLRRNKA